MAFAISRNCYIRKELWSQYVTYNLEHCLHGLVAVTVDGDADEAIGDVQRKLSDRVYLWSFRSSKGDFFLDRKPMADTLFCVCKQAGIQHRNFPYMWLCLLCAQDSRSGGGMIQVRPKGIKVLRQTADGRACLWLTTKVSFTDKEACQQTFSQW